MAHKGAGNQKIFAAAVRQMQQHALHEAAVMVTGVQEPGKAAGEKAYGFGPQHVPDGLTGQTQADAVGKAEQPGTVPVQRIFLPGAIIDPPAFRAALMQPAPAVQPGQGPDQQAGRAAGKTLQHDGPAADDVLAHGLQDLHGTVEGRAAQAAEELPDTFLPVIGKAITEGPTFAPVTIPRPSLQQVGGLRAQDDAVTVDVPLPKGVCGTHDMGFIPVSR